MNALSNLVRWTMSLAVALSLGFGALQALAAPAEAAERQTCNRRECNEYCKAQGASGDCVGGMCVCRIPVG